MKTQKVTIIFNDDGASCMEYNGEGITFGDTGETVDEVSRALEKCGFKTGIIPLKKGRLDEFIGRLTKDETGIVFNLCEGAFDRSELEMNVTALLELYGVRFTGNSAITLGVALNKGWTKAILKSADIPTAKYRVVERLPMEAPKDPKFPLIVKPLMEDASIGINTKSVVNNAVDLEERVEWVFREYNKPVLVEEYIEGREFNISVIGNGEKARALAPSEVDFSNYPEGFARICGFEAKWVKISPFYINTPPVCPADIPESLKRHFDSIALKSYEALNCRDYARVDMRLGRDGNVRVLEVNPNPDLSMDAGIARAARCDGMEYHEFIGELVRIALERYK